jgi:hypothetical protein
MTDLPRPVVSTLLVITVPNSTLPIFLEPFAEVAICGGGDASAAF